VFTGIVETVGSLEWNRPAGGGRRLSVAFDPGDEPLRPGESVAVCGVCLTVSRAREGGAEFDVSEETARATTLAALGPGAPVNIERALRASSRLGGHFVQGHVDGLGRVQGLDRGSEGAVLRILLPPALMDLCVRKGSIAVEGVSLTVAGIEGGTIRCALIPETLSRTTLGGLTPGRDVNVECDVLGKYVYRFLQNLRSRGDTGTLGEDFLREAGFL
jgi:riboflavin synthase